MEFKRIHLFFLLVFITFAVILVLYLGNKGRNFTKVIEKHEKEPIIISVYDVINSIHDNFYGDFPGNTQNPDMLESIVCNEKQICSKNYVNHPSVNAWRILALSRLAFLNDDKDKYMENLTWNLSQWNKSMEDSFEATVYASHQLFDAYQLVKHPGLLTGFWSGISRVEKYVDNIYLNNEIPGELRMMSMVLVRQLSLASVSLSDASDRKYLTENHPMFVGYSEHDFLLKSEGLRDKSIKLYEKLENYHKSKENTHRPIDESKPEISSDMCFNVHAMGALYRATGDNKYKESIRAFYDAIDFEKDSISGINFQYMQNVLACLHSLHEVEDLKDTYPNVVEALLKILISNTSTTEKCDNENLLLSYYNIQPEVFSKNCMLKTASVADNSWFIYLIDKSRQNEKYEFFN